MVESSEVFEPVMGDSESEALAWIALDLVESFELHPGFGKSWPALKLKLEDLAN